MNKLFTYNLLKMHSTYLLRNVMSCSHRNYSEITHVLNNRLIINENVMNWRLVLTQCRFKGHSKWQNIKSTKEANDMIKGQAFNRLITKINKAVKLQGGGDPHINRELAVILDQCRIAKMPKTTSDRAIHRALNRYTKPLKVELIGPNGCFIVLDLETQNADKFTRQLRKIMVTETGFGFASAGHASRFFEDKGIIKVKITDKDGNQIEINKAEDIAIEANAEEVFIDDEDDDENLIVFVTDISNFSKCKLYIENNTNFEITESGIELFPLQRVALEEADLKRVEQFTQQLDNIEDTSINRIYDNIE